MRSTKEGSEGRGRRKKEEGMRKGGREEKGRKGEREIIKDLLHTENDLNNVTTRAHDLNIYSYTFLRK